jgi:hypothetical protein
MIQVYVATDLVDAEMVAAELIGSGINAVVQGDLIAIPSGPFPTVWVEEAHLEQTREILAGRESDANWVDPD